MTISLKAVVFDLDGLMFNTEHIFHRAGDELLRRRGKAMTAECLHRMIGRRPREAFTAMVELFALNESIDHLLAESQAIFTALLDEHLAAMPGLFELLELIERQQLPKGVATSSPRKYLLNLLRRYELESRFSITLCSEDVTYGKPHPEIYLRAAEALRVEPAEMLVLEDSQAGAQAAVAAGAVVVAVPHDHTRHQNFDGTHAVIDSLEHELLRDLLNGGAG